MFEIYKICFNDGKSVLDKLFSQQSAFFSMLFSLLILIAPAGVWAEITKPPLQVIESKFLATETESQIKHLKESIINLQESLSRQHQTVNNKFSHFEECQNKANTNLHKLRDSLNSLDSYVYKNSYKILELENEATSFILDNNRNKEASMLILLSLLFEIPAVIFLSSTSLWVIWGSGRINCLK